MKKEYLWVIFATVLLNINAASALEISEIEALKQALSATYGAEVNVEADGDTCKVVYPHVEINEEVTETIESENPDEAPRVETKTVKEEIPETTAECARTEDFKTYPQYKISITSPAKFIAQFYNVWRLPFIKDVEIKSYREDFDFVPELGFMRASNLQMSDVAYTQTDSTTGLKREMGRMGSYNLQQTLSEDAGNIVQNVEMSLNSLSLALPFLSVQANSEHHLAEMQYKVPEGKSFDYIVLVNNLQYLMSAKSSAVGRGIKFGSDMLGLSVSFDTEVKNNTKRNDDETLYTFGSVLLKNIIITGDLIDKAKHPQAIAFKYTLKDIPAASLNRLNQIQLERSEEWQKKLDAEPIDDEDLPDAVDEAIENRNDEQMAKVLDEIAATAKFATKVELNFNNADITVEGAFERKNGYLHGISKVKVNNLFNIFPKQQQCVNNPRAAEIPDCNNDMTFMGLQELIDTTQNNSETVYKYTEQGVFKNDTKIGDPIELSFEKMYREKQERDRQKAELMRQMMEQQKAAAGVK